MQIRKDLGKGHQAVEFAVVEDRQDGASVVSAASLGQQGCLDAADRRQALEAEPDKEKACLEGQTEEM
jgi:hypothetical protein